METIELSYGNTDTPPQAGHYVFLLKLGLALRSGN